MTFRIHFQWSLPDGTYDYFDFSGDSIEEIQTTALKALVVRNIDMNTCWSEQIDGSS